MSRTCKTFWLFVVFIYWGCHISAQKKSFAEGYIIKKEGDTIYGLIKDRSSEPFVSLYTKVRFKEGGRARTKKYNPDAILGYGYRELHFLSIPLRAESNFFRLRYYSDAKAASVFLKVLATSEKLMYFERLFVHDDNNSIDAFPLFYRPGSKEMVRVTQGIFGSNRKRLADYFSDCPALVKAITKTNSNIRTVPELYEYLTDHCKL
ncbi:MAG: hypothetical protein AAGF96_01130 [Bacteroidota bacterium]